MARTCASYSVIAFRPPNARASCLKRASARLFRTSFEFIVTIIFFSACLFLHNLFHCLVVVAGSLFKEKPRTRKWRGMSLQRSLRGAANFKELLFIFPAIAIGI